MTYPRTYSGHFWNMSLFDDSSAIWVLLRKWVLSENLSVLNEGVTITQLPLYRLSTTFLTLSWRVKVYLLLRYCIKSQSIGVCMYRNCKWLPSWVTCLAYLTCMCMCTCMCAHVQVRDTLYTSTTPSTHHPLPMGTPPISKNAISLKLMKKIQFRLKIWNLWRLPYLQVGVWFGGGWVEGGWVGGWVYGWDHVKSLKIE